MDRCVDRGTSRRYDPYTEAYMELSKKTTILFSPELHAHLTIVARQQGVSLGELVRSACERAYGSVSIESRVQAVAELGTLSLPVDTPGNMKRQSVPDPPEDLP